MFLGADTEALRGMAGRMEGEAARLEELVSTLLGQVDTVTWDGPDADAFRSRAQSCLQQQGHIVVETLRQCGDRLAVNADEQDAVSEPEGEAGDVGGGPGTSGSSPSPTAALSGNERDGGDESGDSTSRDGTSDDPGDGTIPGPQPYPGIGLGPGVPGESAETPEPPAWEPADEGAGEWNVREPTDADLDTESLVELLILGGQLTGRGAASDNLQHYLDGEGRDRPIDVDDMLQRVPEFARQVGEQQRAIGMEAVQQARDSGATGPVTFPVSTPWTGGSARQGSGDDTYFYATGSFDHNQTGTVTAYPPSTPGGEWTYEVDTQTNVRDRYNWDTGKGVTIDIPDWALGFPDTIHIPDEQMQDLHECGLAREFNIVGASQGNTVTGP